MKCKIGGGGFVCPTCGMLYILERLIFDQGAPNPIWGFKQCKKKNCFHLHTVTIFGHFADVAYLCIQFHFLPSQLE